MAKYLTSPVASTTMPKGIPYIVGNEAAERFSFYGMRTILFIFMTQYLLASDGSGARAVMSDDEAKEYYHWFVASAYFFPIIGAVISDAFLGKYRTILFLSIVYCFGHLALAVDETRLGLFVGLALIAVGTGAIKPCVSAHVGDQFGKMNQHLLSKVFGWFYFAINLGAAASTWLTPILLNTPGYGPRWAFGIPGVLMALATVVFWMGRNKFIHVPPGGMASVRQAFSGAGLKAIRNLVLIYVCVMMFWSLFDQTGTAWVQQARRMDRVWPNYEWLPSWLNYEWLPSQIQAANPILVMIFVPLFAYVIYPTINRFYPLTPLRKIAIGFFLTVPAFAIPALIGRSITGGEVIRATSEGDMDQWPVENLLDGDTEGSGWVSTALKNSRKPQEKDSPEPQEIVLRLRERRPWEIESIEFYPATELATFLRGQRKPDENEKPVTREEIEACWAKDVEVFVASTRKGDPQLDKSGNPVLDEQGNPELKWTHKLGQLTLQQSKQGQALNLDEPVEAEYVLIRIKSNWGGSYVSMGEIEVNAAGALPGDAHSQAADVWPNVAATGYKPNIIWQLLAYVVMTAAEIMVSITCLEFSYTQAPNKMKSFIMALYLLSVSAGNVFTALVNRFIQRSDGSSKLEGANYYWFFTAAILATSLIFLVVAKTYRGETYIQDDANGESTPET